LEIKEFTGLKVKLEKRTKLCIPGNGSLLFSDGNSFGNFFLGRQSILKLCKRLVF